MAATATAVAPVAAETGKVERERDTAAAAAVEAVAAAAAAEMEERTEARFGEAPLVEVEEPEVPRGCENAMMRICPPFTFGTGKTRVLS